MALQRVHGSLRCVSEGLGGLYGVSWGLRGVPEGLIGVFPKGFWRSTWRSYGRSRVFQGVAEGYRGFQGSQEVSRDLRGVSESLKVSLGDPSGFQRGVPAGLKNVSGDLREYQKISGAF